MLRQATEVMEYVILFLIAVVILISLKMVRTNYWMIYFTRPETGFIQKKWLKILYSVFRIL